ncbi:MAG: dihydropteroate synthase [Bacteroidales bacterium]|nr:dihydropteroate synthase [Candidatus Latescibacterota bacterium]
MTRYPLRMIFSRRPEILKRHFEHAGVTPAGIRIMASKAKSVVIRADALPAAAANIIKQQLLSLGGDAAVHRDVIRGGPENSTVFLIGDERRLRSLAERLRGQPFGLEELGQEVISQIDLHLSPPLSVGLAGASIDLSNGPVIMGILNVTPDSFSDGGRFIDPSQGLDRALEMVEEGAGIIDIGGESSRPGASELKVEEELARVMPLLKRLQGTLPVPVSIDTRKAAVADAAVEAGASIINDISGLTHDEAMTGTVVRHGTAVVVMHMLGTPETMQDTPSYSDPVSEIISWLEGRTTDLIDAGIEREKIIIDPGLGFGKRLQDNLEILEQAGDFHSLGFPVLTGHSRKSFIGTITGKEPADRLAGGLAAVGACLEAGIQILRVHDIGATVDFVKTWKAINRKDNDS